MKRVDLVDLEEILGPRPEPAPSELRRRRRAKKRGRHRSRAQSRLDLSVAGALPPHAVATARSHGWWPYTIRLILEDAQAARKPLDRSSSQEQMANWFRAQEEMLRRIEQRAIQLLRVIQLET